MGLLLTCSTSLLNFIGNLSALWTEDKILYNDHSQRKRTFFLSVNELHSMLTPWLTMVTSRLWVALKNSVNSLSVGSFLNSIRSQRVHSVSPNLFFFAAIGSENPKKGKARLINPFLYSSSFLLPSTISRACKQLALNNDLRSHLVKLQTN